MTYEAEREKALALKAKKDEAHAAWKAAIDAHEAQVKVAAAAAPDDLSQNEIARQLDLNPSTYRVIVNKAPK